MNNKGNYFILINGELKMIPLIEVFDIIGEVTDGSINFKQQNKIIKYFNNLDKLQKERDQKIDELLDED